MINIYHIQKVSKLVSQIFGFSGVDLQLQDAKEW